MTARDDVIEQLVEVEPGAEASCQLTIRNDTAIVEEYDLEVGGDVGGWATVEPNRVAIYPGTEQAVVLTFRPPRLRGPAAGEVPYKVHVVPVEQPAGQLVIEGILRVLPFADLSAEVVPRTSTSRVWGGRHEVAVDNRGNTPVELRVTGTDPDRRLAFEARPAVFTVGPGAASFVKLRARPARIQLIGQPASRPFQIVLHSPVAPPLALDATMLQRAVIPPGTMRTLAGLIALTMLGTALWIGLVRRAVTTAAQQVVREEVVPVARDADAARRAAEAAASTAAGSPGRPPPPSSAPAGGPDGIPAGATLFSQRLETSGAAGQTDRAEYRVPKKMTLIVTYADLQNPGGARGPVDLMVDDRTLFTVEQGYFRKETFYVPTPIQVTAGQRVRLRMTCASPGVPMPGETGPAKCLSYVLIGGYLMKVRSGSG